MKGLWVRLFGELKRNWRLYLVSLIAAGFSSGAYLYWSALGKGPGFPLDDAWIHQTYARNLAQTGEMAYLPGQPSAGSTSPAWSFLLSVAYMSNPATPMLWAYLAGGCSLDEAVAAAQRATRNLAKRQLTWLRSEPSWIGIPSLEDQELVPILRVMSTVAAR